MIQSKFSNTTYLSLFLTPICIIGIGLLLSDNLIAYLYGFHPITSQSYEVRHLTLIIFLLIFVFAICILSTIVVYMTLQKIFVDSIEKIISFKYVFSKSKLISSIQKSMDIMIQFNTCSMNYIKFCYCTEAIVLFNRLQVLSMLTLMKWKRKFLNLNAWKHGNIR